MFQDENQGCVEFKSSWKTEKYVIDNYCQTPEMKIQDRTNQSVKRKDEEVQTEGEDAGNVQPGLADDRDLVDLLRRWEPYLLNVMKKNIRSNAFDAFDVSWQEKATAVTNIHTLSNAAFEGEFEVTSLSWNATGSVIAVAFGRYDHEDWCTHRSSLCTWNLDRHQLDTTKPDTSVDVSSCLMCVSCHPVQPALVAGGTFNGEVIIWDLSRADDPVLMSSAASDDGHREPVTKVTWVQDTESSSRKYNLCSVSQDGKILVWSVDQKKQNLLLLDGSILLSGNMPRSVRVTRRDSEMGVSCISFSPEDREVFVCGSETGGLFKCSVHARAEPAGRHIESSIPLHSPVTLSYNTHAGPVHAVQCSPFHRNLLLSCSADGTACIYNMLQTSPAVTLEPGAGYLYDADWSPTRPQVLALATETGKLLIFDLRVNPSTPVHKLDACSRDKPVYCLQFNHKQPRLLATGDSTGYIKVWQLSDELVSANPSELSALSELFQDGQD